MTKDLYSEFIYSTNVEGSGKASSYIRALDLISEMLLVEPFGFHDCIDIWHVTSLNRINELRDLVVAQKQMGQACAWITQGVPSSYLSNGYCQAALTSFLKFLVGMNQENSLIDIFQNHEGSASELPGLLGTNPEYPDVLKHSLKGQSGKDIIRSLKMRLNQRVFRRMIMNIYSDSCCITGLNIPEVNRASHIIPWAKDEDKRLDPCNGLCLSATYDAAFDKNLISLDDDYRIIVSKEISDYHTRSCVSEYYLNKVG